MKKKNYVIYIFLVAILVVILVVFFIVIKSFYSKKNDIFIKYDSNSNIILSNLLPMTDIVGKEIKSDSHKNGVTGYIEFEVKSSVDKRVKFDIYLIKNNLKNEIPTKFIKLYLTDEFDNVIKLNDSFEILTYYDLKDYDNSENKLLYSGTIEDKKCKKFRLRMWVADTYELTLDERNFSAKLNVVQK